MHLLVACTDYPDLNGNKSLYFVHVRNQYYMNNGINVTVLNFSSKKNYNIDNINVITLKNFIASNIKYNLLICHAPNLRHHYKFIKKYNNKFENFILIFHGHEILKINKEYPPKYSFVKKTIPKVLQNMYDFVKLKIWRNFILNNIQKLSLVFVSNYLFNSAMKYLDIDELIIKKKSHIINNAIGTIFEKENYIINSNKEFDFITIRSNLDSSTYCIDLLCKIASQNPSLKFLLIGKGSFFDHNHLPKNVTLVKDHFNHEKLIDYINSAKGAIMLTRNDTQGLMSCELATFGIPLITSKIPVTEEIMECFDNVTLIDNSEINIDLNKWLLTNSNKIVPKCEKYFAKNTVMKEILLIKNLINNA